MGHLHGPIDHTLSIVVEVSKYALDKARIEKQHFRHAER